VIASDDRGFTLGDGVFETVLADQGRLVAVDRHFERLARSAALIGLPEPPGERCRAAASRALVTAGLENARAAVRISWSAGAGARGLDRPDPLVPALTVAVAPSPRPEQPARLHLAGVRRNESSPASRAKTLAYLDNVLARREAREAGADEAVMLNTRGELACAAAANLFWIKGDRLFTPALACGALSGLVRADVLGVVAVSGLDVHEIAAGPEALAEAEAVFITNSLIGVRAARFGSADPNHPALAGVALAVDRLRASA
jgi:branched-chain amino acid aminotransferase/4-amino-4-deoxychorismate lyase